MRLRRFSPIEIAVAVSLGATLAAVGIPAFARELSASHFVEPMSGLERLGTSAVSFAEAQGAYPVTVPLTPAVPPRGKKEVDPPGTWDAPTWRALGFRASAEGVPHAYAFAFEHTPTGFTATAHGDLDGDGVDSTFEIRGTSRPGEKPAVVPGMFIDAELE